MSRKFHTKQKSRRPGFFNPGVAHLSPSRSGVCEMFRQLRCSPSVKTNALVKSLTAGSASRAASG
jgi:hypothetical protein